jgi:hypothetical protein
MMDASETIAQLAGLFVRHDRPGADERTGAFWWGAQDEEIAWALSLAHTVSPDPIARHLYVAHAAQDVRHSRAIKDWGYRVAVEFAGAKGSGQRRRSLVESYRTDWGHQAARDGICMALWPDLRDEVPGIGKRADQYGCGKQAYQRVRDEVQRQACDLIAGFKLDVTEALAERYSRDFIGRWESVTGRVWNEPTSNR